MTLVKRNNSLFNPMNGLFDDFINRNLFDLSKPNFADTGTTLPAVNVKETDENFMVEMAAPGLQKEDFKVELENDMLTISSEKQQENNEENGNYSRKEFSYQSFQRSFHLSKEAVDADNIQAKYENGVLHLNIPKRDEVKKKPARLININ